MKKVVMLALMFTVATSFAQRTATIVVQNFSTVGNSYSFEVWGKRTGSNVVNLGTSSFYFQYNAAALNNPTLTYRNPKFNTAPKYFPMSVAIVGGRIGASIEIDTVNAGGWEQLSSDEPYGEHLFTVSLNITDPLATAGLQWDTLNTGVTNAFPQGGVAATLEGSNNWLLPVQLASFTARVINQEGHVRLDWRTASETSNFGFYVQKSQSATSGWQTISELIPGHGTTLEPHNYSWTDFSGTGTGWYYRLKQVDMDGTEHFTEPIQPSGVTGVKDKRLPREFALKQNYPNPFNPSTQIEYAVPKQSNVRLEVFNLLGQKVATLVDGLKDAGFHSVEFNANGLSSGLYFYRLTADGNVNFLRKMVLMR